MATKIAKASTIHGKRLQAATIKATNLAIGSGAIGFENVGLGVFLNVAMLCYSLLELSPKSCDVKSGSSGLSLRSDNLESGGELYTKDDFREPFAAVELSIAKGTGPIALMREEEPGSSFQIACWRNSHSSTANQTRKSPNCRSR